MQFLLSDEWGWSQSLRSCHSEGKSSERMLFQSLGCYFVMDLIAGLLWQFIKFHLKLKVTTLSKFRVFDLARFSSKMQRIICKRAAYPFTRIQSIVYISLNRNCVRSHGGGVNNHGCPNTFPQRSFHSWSRLLVHTLVVHAPRILVIKSALRRNT